MWARSRKDYPLLGGAAFFRIFEIMQPWHHNSWSLDRISWAYLQTLITNNLQIFLDIIKANKVTALAILKESLFHLHELQMLPRMKAKTLSKGIKILSILSRDMELSKKYQSFFLPSLLFLNLKNKANFRGWVNLHHAYGILSIVGFFKFS